MSGGAGLGNQALGSAQAGSQGEQPQPVGDPGRVFTRTRHVDAQHPAEAVHLRFRQGVAGEVGQAGVVHAGDAGVTGHRFGDGLRRGVLLSNPDDQGAQAAR